MGKDKKKIQVVAGLFRQQGKILAAKRGDRKIHGGLWELPGGKIEKGEDPINALKRELLEELLIEVNVVSFVASSRVLSDDIQIEMSVFEVQIVRGKPVPTEHEELRWIHPVEIEHLHWAPADIPLLPDVKKYCRDKREG